MPEYVNLLGAEEVGTAGRNIREAGIEMMRAANRIDESLREHMQFMDEWLRQYREILMADVVGRS